LGVVIIGRNEGERLKRCLESLGEHANRAVYVDSGSTDGSVAESKARGFAVVQLDLRTPFTAARARNEGFNRLLELEPTLEFVFFVDGDCEVCSGWLDIAVRFLKAHQDVAVVCGRRRERFPEKSIYNMLCDFEWAGQPAGEARACGGDALMRVASFRSAGGYRAELICGEEPELCVRLRQAGWKIWCLDIPMTLHDAAMYRFGQWWKRMMRGGYAYALGVSLHGAPPERHFVREYRSAWLWGLFIPLVVCAAVLFFGPWAFALLAVYPLQIARLMLRGSGSARENWWRSAALVGCKVPEMIGQMKCLADRWTDSRVKLIEYK
jgi:glycosyltransferase involved in cell wall biosynthesis